MMITIEIDNRTIKAEKGTPLIEVARLNGIDIPSLCYHQGFPLYTSCSVCLVKDLETGAFLRSCAVLTQEGMRIDASGEEVRDLRKDALSMLLSEHRAECEAPCSKVCPLDLNIPALNRLIQKGNIISAAKLAFLEMGLPETICRFCVGYCENACRRKMIDHPLSITGIKKFASSYTAESGARVSFAENKDRKKIAITGGGITGLITAFFLTREGHRCVIFEKTDKLGGRLIAALDEKDPGRTIFEMESNRILNLGVEVNYGSFIDARAISKLLNELFDGVIITVPGIESTNLDARRIFKTGRALSNYKQVVREWGQAKTTILAINTALKTGRSKPAIKEFNSTIGRIRDDEKKAWLQEVSSDSSRYNEPVSTEEARSEANNCLRCDCRGQSDCRLRALATQYELKNPKDKLSGHPIAKKVNEKSGLIFENAKCVKCGLCVRLLRQKTDKPLLGFQHRGFQSVISEPLGFSFDEILQDETESLVGICPTGALTKKG